MADTSKTKCSNTDHNHQHNGVLTMKGGSNNVNNAVTNGSTTTITTTATTNTQTLDHTTLEMVENEQNYFALASQSSQTDLVPQDRTEDQSSVDDDAMIYCCLETNMFKLFVCFVTGFMFGLAMEKGRGTV